MGSFTPAKNLLGVDGYFRFQKEAAYGTAIDNAMSCLAILPDTMLNASIANIENANVINSRLKQAPNAGRRIVTGEIKADIYPDQLGAFINGLLGLSADAGDANAAYTHTWLLPITGERILTSFTMEQALGAQTARQFKGCTITGITIASDTEKNQTITLRVTGQDYSTGEARPATLTYSAKTPYYFGQGKVELTPTGTTKFEQYVKSFELSIDLGYKTDDFRVGSNKIIQPSYNSIPTCTCKFSVEADENFRAYAESKLATAILFSFDSGQQAGAVSGNYQYFVEIPGARLSPETTIKNGVEKLTMDLEFECGFGGVTTGSAAVPVMAEIRVVDATAAYTAQA